MRKIFISTAIGLFFFVSPVFATIIRVPQDQPTIQAGINAAVNGDTVLVEPGVYNEDISFLAKSIVLLSRAGADSTVILADESGSPIVTFPAGFYTCKLYGFKISNAAGAFAVLIDGGNVTISNNIITADTNGGILINSGNVTIDSNQFFDYKYIAILAFGGDILVNRNLIRDGEYAIDINGNSDFVIINNTIVQNSIFGIFYVSGTAQLTNNIIAFNGTGLSGGPNDYNDVFGNNSDYVGASPGPHDISLNPLFVDTSLNNFHLFPQSPCIDAGDPATVVPNGSRVDIGAFEFPNLPLISPPRNNRTSFQQPTFIWHSLLDTTPFNSFVYRVVFATNINFSNPDSSPNLIDTTWQPSFNLDEFTTYYWTVRIADSAGNTYGSPDVFSFHIGRTLIIVPDDRSIIQEAIDISLDDDTVLVEPGVYQQNIFFNGKRIKLLSENGADNTTISKLVDGAPLVSFSGTEDSSTVLRGFTLKGARLVSNGAAINVAGASPIIENNLIQDNQGDSAVIYVQGGSPKIRRNLIAENNCNLAAIGFFGGAGGQIINNTIASNTGDGVRIGPTMAMQIKNNILAFNSGYGIRSIGGINNSSTVSYNDNFSNTLGTYFATIPTTGEIYQNPQFRGGNPFDYRLQGSSPCIDSGDPGFPVPPGGGTRVDIGAFEFVPMLGDLNGDGMFTPSDVVLELNCVFLSTGNCNFAMADMNCDSQLSPADVVLILSFVFLGSPLPC